MLNLQSQWSPSWGALDKHQKTHTPCADVFHSLMRQHFHQQLGGMHENDAWVLERKTSSHLTHTTFANYGKISQVTQIQAQLRFSISDSAGRARLRPRGPGGAAASGGWWCCWWRCDGGAGKERSLRSAASGRASACRRWRDSCSYLRETSPASLGATVMQRIPFPVLTCWLDSCCLRQP